MGTGAQSPPLPGDVLSLGQCWEQRPRLWNTRALCMSWKTASLDALQDEAFCRHG